MNGPITTHRAESSKYAAVDPGTNKYAIRATHPHPPLRRAIADVSNYLTSKLSRHRVLRVGVIVESFARLSAVPAGQHQALQQRGRGKAALLELVVHDVRDVV